METTLHDVLIEGAAAVREATYDRFGMRVVPCGTSLAAFEAADPESDAARGARRAGLPLLEHAPESDAARAFRDAARALDVRAGDSDAVADRFRHAVIPQPP